MTTRYSARTDKGNIVEVDFNSTTGDISVKVIDKEKTGGSEVFAQKLDEDVLLSHLAEADIEG